MHPRHSVNTLVFKYHSFFIRYHTHEISMYTLHVTWLCVVEAQRVDVSSVSLHLFLSQSSSRLTMHALWSTKNILSATHRKHVSILSVRSMYVHMHGATCVRTTSHGAATDILKFKLRQIRSNIRSDKLCSAFSFISYNHNLICQSESKLNRTSFDIGREQLSISTFDDSNKYLKVNFFLKK